MNPRKTRFFNRGFGGIGGAGGGGAPAETYISVVQPDSSIAVFSDIELKFPWVGKGVGGDTDIYFALTGGGIAPATGGNSILLLDLPVPLTSDDHWISWDVDDDTWDGSADYMGGTVRHSRTAETCYGFWHDTDDYELYKKVAGAKTNLKTGAVTPVPGSDTWRLEAEGTAIRVYRNDVLFESATDSAVSSGDTVAIVGMGFDTDNKVNNYRAGDLPYPTDAVVTPRGWLSNIYSGLIIDECAGMVFGNLIADISLSSGGGHLSTPEVGGHYLTFDFGELRSVSRMRTNKDAGVDSSFDLSDVDILTKRESGDSWTEVATGLATSHVNVNGWGYIAFPETVARYVKVVINATLHAGDRFESDEIEFSGGEENNFWWLAETMSPEDCVGAWKFKGAVQYASSLNNWNLPNTQRLTEVVGTVDWSFGQGAECDGTDFLDTGYTPDGVIDHTWIVRFRRLQHTGTDASIFGDDAATNTISSGKQAAGAFGAWNNTALTFWSPGDADISDPSLDWVIALTENRMYGNGPLVDTAITPYLNAAAASTVKIGGQGAVGTAIDIYAFAAYNRVLTGTEIAEITAKMQEL